MRASGFHKPGGRGWRRGSGFRVVVASSRDGGAAGPLLLIAPL